MSREWRVSVLALLHRLLGEMGIFFGMDWIHGALDTCTTEDSF